MQEGNDDQLRTRREAKVFIGTFCWARVRLCCPLEIKSECQNDASIEQSKAIETEHENHNHHSLKHVILSSSPLPKPLQHHHSHPLLQRNKPTTMRRPNPRPSMLNRLVTDTELAQIKPDHLRPNLDLIELLAAVDANHTTNHLGDHNHVAQVRLDHVGLLVGLGGLLGFAELFDQAHGFGFEAPVEAAAGAGVDDVAELVVGEVQESGGRGGLVDSSRYRGKRFEGIVMS